MGCGCGCVGGQTTREYVTGVGYCIINLVMRTGGKVFEIQPPSFSPNTHPLFDAFFREHLTFRQLAGLIFSVGTQESNRSSKIRVILFTFCILVFFAFFLQPRGICDRYLLLSPHAPAESFQKFRMECT